ncbi:hypothetical protein O181_036851 [Austropuccinia psidii MF-1]|uniref:Uncharacterized protein n=1 Tax=Austropuccinia psidii MF-1 TaxID=1389203 RepID=A0A9Q3DAZ4_9BASI|nr:hypothetical protein [Austropuccinia psidii MF-1]
MHMHISDTYEPANTAATAPPRRHTHASRSAPAPAPPHAHANSGLTCVTFKWLMQLDIRPSHALPLCACGTPKPAALCTGLQACHPLMLSCFMATQN